MKRSGDKVLINGHEYELGEKIGGGLEGSVFVSKDNPKFVIKLINTAHMNARAKQELREHLMWLKNTIGANDELKNKLAVPKALVEGDDIGYIMYRASEYDNLKTYMTFPAGDVQAFVKWYKDNYKLKKRLQIASFLFNALELIHISGLLFTDLSPNNIMVSRNKNSLVFIDTDNMRRKRDAYLSVVGTDGYMAPEIYIGLNEINKKVNSAEFDKTELPKSGRLSAESDIFSAAIIVFQLLTLQHPFVGDAIEDGPAEGESAALRCETDYILHKNMSNTSSTPFVELFDRCKIVTPKIKELFYKTFVGGKNNPAVRPTAVEFAEAFDDAQDILATCDTCGADSIYSLEEESCCWDCDAILKDRIVLEIFNGYDESMRDKLVAKILGDTPLNESDEKNPFIRIASVVLEKGKDKYLYLRHFERTTHRSSAFAKITVVDDISGNVRLQIVDTSIIQACYLIDRRSQGTFIPIDDLKKAKEFVIDRYAILFEISQTRVGRIRTIGMLSRK